YQINEKHAIGLSYQHLGVPDFSFFSGPFASYPFHQFSPKLSYAQKRNHFQWGVSLAYVEAGSELGQTAIKNSRGIGFSAGISTEQQFWGLDWIFGASLNDYGPRHLAEAVSPFRDDFYRYLPTTFRIGGQSTLSRPNTQLNFNYQFEHFMLPRDLSQINSGWLAPVQSIGDAPRGENWQDWQFKLGLAGSQIAISKVLDLSLRLGWQYEAPERGGRHLLTTGAGIVSKSFDLDAAFWIPLSPNHPLQNTLMFSLTYRWNPT
ncbi:MAG: PorV/PorQ family protein, partial [Bacteroidota bacterium]